jgi:hypothetical protein
VTDQPEHSTTYFGHLMAGRDPGDLDDWVERWHDGDSKLELHEYLGMTWEEYGLHVRLSDVLPELIELRRTPDPKAMAALEERAQLAWAGIGAQIMRDVGRLN